MWRCLEPDVEILVRQGHLYLPLLLDPDLHREVQGRIPQDQVREAADGGLTEAPPPVILTVGDRRFVQAVSLLSLVDNYPQLHSQAFAHYRQALQEQYSLTADLWGITLDPKLVTIVFHILPHFVRRDGLKKRVRPREGEVLDLIRERLPVPRHFDQEARKFLDLTPLQEALRRLENTVVETPALPEGLMSMARVRAWWQEALTARLLAAERTRLLQELQDRERWAAAQEERLAVLLYVAHKGSLEVDGFGFARVGKGQDYRIYKRTGAFALKDFYGRLYLFPDCRVAVTTVGRLRPVVVEHYKHPFLRGQGSGQAICLGPDSQNLTFSAKNVIRALDEGISALFYTYDPRRGHGYHSLEAPPGKVRQVHFDDYRIPSDHPLTVSGEVEVKNRAT